jgi:hypothetical protein
MMLKEAIEKIEEMSSPLVYTEGNHSYVLYADHTQELRPAIDSPETVRLNSLDALVQLVKKEQQDRQIFVSVTGHDEVDVYDSPSEDTRWKRNVLYNARAIDIPGWEPEVQMGFDQAAVALMTRFQDGGDREYTLQLLSQITTGAKVTYTDNGVASTIVTQKGAALAQNTTIKPLVKLRPYRTFQEIEQPEGIFLIRISERGITFREADGGMWKLTARNTAKAWLQEQLQDMPNVTVML